ncbi:hypothetical protein V6N13_007878 [Hibiscus sabdariffa]
MKLCENSLCALREISKSVVEEQQTNFNGINPTIEYDNEETQGLQLYIKTWADLKQSIARTLEEIRRSDDQDFYLP